MKNVLVIALVLLTTMMGCELLGIQTTFAFHNDSDYEITVTPNGQEWSEFVMFPGDTREVTVAGDEIHFTHSESDWYEMSSYPSSDTYRFENATLYTWTFVNNSSYTVTIRPQTGENAQEWTAFDIAPGETRDLSIPYTSIYLTYNYASSVDFIKNDDGWEIVDL